MVGLSRCCGGRSEQVRVEGDPKSGSPMRGANAATLGLNTPVRG